VPALPPAGGRDHRRCRAAGRQSGRLGTSYIEPAAFVFGGHACVAPAPPPGQHLAFDKGTGFYLVAQDVSELLTDRTYFRRISERVLVHLQFHQQLSLIIFLPNFVPAVSDIYVGS
jgi:hypothetical protein